MSTFERFVLIDDNEPDNVFHEIMIRRAGFTGEVLVFYSGEEALDFFRRDDLSIPTCVFVDINMPMMSGFEMAEAAAPLIAEKPSVVLMMLTSSGSPADRARAQSMNMIKGYVTKPVTASAVRELLDGQIPAFSRLR